MSFLGDFSPLTESSPVQSLRSLPFPPLCSPNQEQLCSSTVVSHSLSGNLKAINRAPHCYPTPFCVWVCVPVSVSLICVCTQRHLYAHLCVHVESQNTPSAPHSTFETASLKAASLIESPCFQVKHFKQSAELICVWCTAWPCRVLPPTPWTLCCNPAMSIGIAGGVTWGHVVFECGTTKTRPRRNSLLLVHFLGLASELPCQEKTTSPEPFIRRALQASLYRHRHSCMHEHTPQADVRGDRARKLERQGKKEIRRQGARPWDGESTFWMPKVKSMVLSAVFLLSPPPPSLPPLSPVEISHFLQAQCWFHTGAQGLVCEMGKGRHGEVKCGGIWAQAKNNLHLHFSQFLSATFYKINVRVQELFFCCFFLTHPTVTHISTSGRGHSTTAVLYQSCFFSLVTLPFGVFEVFWFSSHDSIQGKLFWSALAGSKGYSLSTGHVPYFSWWCYIVKNASKMHRTLIMHQQGPKIRSKSLKATHHTDG